MKTFRHAAALGLLATSMLVRNAAPAAAAESERRQPMAGFEGTRFAGVTVSSYDAETRSCEAVLSSGAAVSRYYFTEELEISAEAVDLGRVTSGLVCLLDAHNQWEVGAVLGTISDVRIEGGNLVGRLSFADTDRGREVEGMVARGELKGVSIGYKVTTWEITRTDPETERETWRATRWELLEVSLVPVPADANAGVRAAGGPAPGATEEDEDMLNRSTSGGAAAPAQQTPEQIAEAARAAEAARTAEAARASEADAARAAEATRAADAARAAAAGQVTRFSGVGAVTFIEQARSLGGDTLVTRANELVQQNERGEISEETARGALLQAAAERQRAATGGTAGGPRVEVNNGNEEASRNLIVAALCSRALHTPLAEAERGASEYMGLSLLDIARARANVPSSERNPDVILRAAHTTSDFPLLMETAGQRILLERYQAQAPTFTAIARRRNLRDFRVTNLLRVGDFPTLKPYLEDGEIKAGTIGESKETVQLGSFGRRLILTRQAIVNDDIGAFDEVFGSIGIMIAQFENATFYTMKGQNSGNGPNLSDGNPVFHASHGNKAGSGGSMTVPLISAGRAAIRKQTNTEGQVMNLSPRILLVGPDTETLAEQLTAPLVPQQVGNVNPFTGKLEVVAEGAIPDYSWELYADPAVAPVWVYGSLESAPGPRLISKESFSVDGMQYRVTYDFYADATDYRGAYRNAGAAPA